MSVAKSVLVSIVMPAFQARATIAAAAASVVAQSHREWELLIVADDGSDYAHVLRQAGIADARLRFFASPAPGSGPAAARNLAQRHAAGALVTRLDADDLYEPERLKVLVPLALRHGVAADNGVAFEDGGRELGTLLPRGEGSAAVGPLELMVSPFSWCLVFRRELLPAWDEDVPFAEDVLFNARAFEECQALPVDRRVLWRYRVAARSLSHGAGAAERAEAGYARLLAECAAGAPRFEKPALQETWCRALAEKRALNRKFAAVFAAGQAASFQEWAFARTAAAAAGPRGGAEGRALNRTRRPRRAGA